MRHTQKAEIRSQLKADPQKSNRSITTQLGVNDKLGGRLRRDLEEADEIPTVTCFRGVDGRIHKRIAKAHQPGPSASNVLPFTLSRYAPLNTTAPRTQSPVLGQIAKAFTGHPLALFVALPFGGFVSVAVWHLIHLEGLYWRHSCMVAGGAPSFPV